MKMYLCIMSILCSIVYVMASMPASLTELVPEKIIMTSEQRDEKDKIIFRYSRLNSMPFGQSYNISCPRDFDPPLTPDDVTKENKTYVIVFVKAFYTDPPGATDCEAGNPMIAIETVCPATTSRSCLVESRDDSEDPQEQCTKRPLTVAWRCDKATCKGGRCRRIMVLEILP